MMSNSTTRESAADVTYRLLGLVNTYHVLRAYHAAHPNEPMPPAISYRAKQTGRAYQSAAWQVVRPGHKTDPNAHFRDNYAKTFNVYGREEKAPQLEAAQAWAGERYGVTAWAKLRYLRSSGDYVPASVAAWYEAQRKAALRAERQEA